jgi:hypothetical protein
MEARCLSRFHNHIATMQVPRCVDAVKSQVLCTQGRWEAGTEPAMHGLHMVPHYTGAA